MPQIDLMLSGSCAAVLKMATCLASTQSRELAFVKLYLRNEGLRACTARMETNLEDRKAFSQHCAAFHIADYAWMRAGAKNLAQVQAFWQNYLRLFS